MMKSTFRIGFTLIELLVVLSIIGLFVAIAAPAVQSIRSQARQTTCKNNLRQIAIASMSYESANGHFPPGTLGFEFTSPTTIDWFNQGSRYYWRKAQHSSWLTILLPYLEQDNVFENLERDQVLESTNRDFELPVESELTLATFLCPSSRQSKGVIEVYIGSQPCRIDDPTFALDAFNFVQKSHLSGQEKQLFCEITNYLGCSGAHSGGKYSQEYSFYDGVFKSRSTVTTGEIADGTSYSILSGETIGGVEEGRQYAAHSWMFGGMGRARGGLPWKSNVSPINRRIRILGDTRHAYPFGFSSSHESGVNFAFCDGSVRTINKFIGYEVLYSLAGIGDGEVVEPFE